MTSNKIIFSLVFLLFISFAYADIYDDTGVISYYTFESDGTDSIGGFDFPTNASLNYVTGKNGNAINLDLNEYLVTSINSTYWSNAESFSLWVNMDDVTNTPIFNWGDTTNNNRIHIFANGGNKLQGLTALSGSYLGAVEETSTSFSTSTWYHIACTVATAGNNFACWINGNEVTVSPDTTHQGLSSAFTYMYLGRNSGGGQDSDQRYDEVAVFDGQLNQTGVDLLYNSGSGLFYTPPSGPSDPVKTTNIISPVNNYHTNDNTPVIGFNFTSNMSTANCSLIFGGLPLGINISVANNTNTYIETNLSVADNSFNYYVSCYDGVNATNSSSRTLIIDTVYPIANNLNSGFTYNADFTSQIELSDNYLWAYNYSIISPNGEIVYNNESINLSGSTYTIWDYIDTTYWVPGRYNVSLTVSDDHTAKSWSPEDYEKKSDSLKYYIEGAVIEVVALDKDVLNIDTVCEVDRCTFNFTYKKFDKKRDYLLLSTKPLYYRGDLYSFPAFVTANNWIDFNIEGLVSSEVTPINNTAFLVHLEYNKDLKSEVFKSIGGLNIITYNNSYYNFDGDWETVIFIGREKVTNNIINNFAVQYGPNTNTTTNGSTTIIINGTGYQTINFTNTDGYYNGTYTANYSATNSPYNIEMYNHKLIFRANDTLASIPVNNFYIQVNMSSYGFSVDGTTTNGTLTFNLTQGLNYTSLITSAGYARTTANHTELATLNSSFYYQLYPFNSIRFNIYNASNLNLLNQTVVVKLIGENSTQQNSTSTGLLNLPLLDPGDYEFRFSSVGFNTRGLFLTVLNDSTSSIDVYMTENKTTELQIIQVVDTGNVEVEGAIVWLQLEKNGSENDFITVAHAKTDFNGLVGVYVDRDPSIFYRFAVIIDGEPVPIMPNENYFTGKTFFIPGVTETIQLIVNLETELTTFLNDIFGIYTSLTYDEDTYLIDYNWIDGRSLVEGGNLLVFARYSNVTMNYVLVHNTTLNGTSGSLNYSIVPLNNTIYKVQGLVFRNNKYYLTDELTFSFEDEGPTDKNSGLLLAVFIIAGISLLTARFGPLVCALSTVGGLALSGILGLVIMPTALINTFFAFVIIIFLRKRGGSQ